MENQRKKFLQRLIILILIICGYQSFAQTGIVRGSVIDADNGESLIGVTILLKGTSIGTITDLDGKFFLSVDTGIYNIQISYVSYQTQILEDVKIKLNGLILLNNILLQPSNLELDAVIVKADMIRDNESSMMLVKQRSAAMIDGISSDRMALIGDANAVEAAKRVTGVSVEGGKYVYVRGLGDRYSKTTLNGMEIPGLDPDRNSLQMDIFPTSLMNNITISKNFTPDMPADFTGGLMNLETKDFPDDRILSFSASLGYNPSMHFNSDYLKYQGGSTDFLGFDDGTRALPTAAGNQIIPTPTNGAPTDIVTRFINSFNPILGASRSTSLLDGSASFNIANQISIGKTKERNSKLGYIFSLSYKSEYTYYDDVLIGEYQRYSDPERMDLRYATVQEGQMGERSILVGAIAGIAYKTTNTKHRITLMHLQSGISRAAQFLINNNGEAVGQSGYLALSDNLEYNQRSIDNILYSGTRIFKNSKWKTDWGISPTLSLSDDPDIRKTAFTVTPTNTFFSSGAGGNPSRIWRSLQEYNLPVRVDFIYDYDILGSISKLNFGISNIYKYRDYEILFFDIQFFGNQNWPNPDPNIVLTSENIFPNQPNSIYYQSGNNNPNPNEYQSSINNSALYISNELQIASRIRTIIGIRMEYYTQYHTGRDQSYASGDLINGRNLVNENVLETINLFPSINLIYRISEKDNLRLAYSRTVARPSFKELSFAQILDPITNRIFNGSLFSYTNSEGITSWNGNLLETDIDNLDLRWEVFYPEGQMVSVSGFFKRFQNPIELVRIPEQQTSAEFQPRNVGDAMVYGLELEARKHFGFISEALSNLSVNANITVAQSVLTMSDVEFNARKNFEREGETITNQRRMAGQSPYVINAGMMYSSKDLGLDLGVFYNVKGQTIEVVGIGLSPDVYTEPFHSLNLSLNKKLGKKQYTTIDLKAVNILNSTVQSLYKSFEAENQVFSSFNPGISFGIGINHKF